ncbi:glycine cleavage system protein R [Echinimonas agarilytica]|uniref:Glycine cleavage system transcriptional repressor n=1 Tax=Echinimonas agarilytica TaxID=1215918 RepID=A0AA42B8F9_9GAMM|nr:ACT domain-containing protein [Echinimonas agarilytica]MCM2680171.1 amino acid-binding protein [Echinimonas agarilytica]
MKSIVITLIGTDRSGIVDEVSQCLMAHHGNWQASSMSLMAGQFAGIVEARIPEEQLSAVRQSLGQLEGLTVQVVDGHAIEATEALSIDFQVTANDRPGIIQQVSSCLAANKVNVLELDTRCESAAHFGGDLFIAEVHAQLPAGLTEDDLKTALEALSDDLIIDTE